MSVYAMQEETRFSLEFDTLLEEGLLGVVLELEKLLESKDGAGKHGHKYWSQVSSREHLARLKSHLESWEVGQDDDQDSGMPVLLHVIARAVMLRALELNPPSL